MTDLISRRAAIEAFGERPLVWDEWTDEFAIGLRNQYDHDVAAIKSLPPAQQWIPCSERLPEEIGSYPVWTARGFGNHLSTSYWDGKEWNLRVVAWMPLPEPYKEECNG